MTEAEWTQRNAAAVRAALRNAAVRAEVAALLGADGSKVVERRRLEAARRELETLGLLDIEGDPGDPERPATGKARPWRVVED